MLFLRAALPLSCETLNYASGIMWRHLQAIRSRWRELNLRQQALLVLAYVNETVELPAARGAEAPRRGPGREEVRARLRHRGWHPDRDRPGRPRQVLYSDKH